VGYYCKGIFGFLFVFVCGTSRLHRHELVVGFFFLFFLFVVCLVLMFTLVSLLLCSRCGFCTFGDLVYIV